MEKIIFFDTGPIISLVMSNLDWIIPKLKEKFGGKFYITPAVRRELVEHPLTVKRFEFEALQVLRLIEKGVLEVYTNVPQDKANKLVSLANSSFQIENKTLDIMQEGEVEILASALQLNAPIVMDERTIRLMIENNKEMRKLLELRFSKEVEVNPDKVKQFVEITKDIKIIRSVELVGLAYSFGLLNDYIPKLKEGKEILADSVLWSVKYNGCAVTESEIEEFKKILLNQK